jgi:hypothetical protein
MLQARGIIPKYVGKGEELDMKPVLINIESDEEEEEVSYNPV